MTGRIGIRRNALLLLGAVYCLLPVAWVLSASTKSAAELFSTSTLVPGLSLAGNIGDLGAYRGGLFWRWMANTVLYAGVGAAGSTLVSAMAGEPMIENAPATELSYRVFAGPTVIVTGKSPILNVKEQRTYDFRWVCVYVTGKDGWLLAASQATRLPL